MLFTKMYIYLLFRGTLSSSGLMIVSVSSWNTLIQSITPLPNYMTLPSPFPLLPHGSTNTILQSCYKGLRQLGELKLDGEHALAQFHLVTAYGTSHIGTILLQLDLKRGTSLSLMQSLAARRLFFLGILMK